MTQRGNGEGSIYRRTDGRWTAAHYVLRPDGTRVWRAVYGKSRKDVADQLSTLITNTRAGLPLAVESLSRLSKRSEHTSSLQLRSSPTISLCRAQCCSRRSVSGRSSVGRRTPISGQ